MKTIAIFTGSRAEFGLQLPLLEKLKNDKNFIVYLLVGASHLNKDFGKTISEIEESGFSSTNLCHVFILFLCQKFTSLKLKLLIILVRTND